VNKVCKIGYYDDGDFRIYKKKISRTPSVKEDPFLRY
jgi:hypothetical protein